MKDNTIIIVPGYKAQQNMEAYTETICENIMINNTYYGNILMCLTELNELLMESDISSEVKFSYKTDFSDLEIHALYLDKQEYKRHKMDSNQIISNKHYKLIETLSDGISIEENGITLNFNISALHNSIYESRLKYLKKYFSKMLVITEES